MYDDSNIWHESDEWEVMNRRLREQLRQQLEHEATPNAAIIDSQLVKTTEKEVGATTLVDAL